MQVPPEIIIKGFENTPDVDRMIQRSIARLEKVYASIVSVRITIDQMQGRHQTGNPYRMLINIVIPGHQIVVKRCSKAAKKIPDGLAEVEAEITAGGSEPKRLPLIRRNLLPVKGKKEEPLIALIRRTFDSAQRELESAVEIERGKVKTPGVLLGIVEKISRDEGYGFLRALDGEQIYFHRNSVLHGHWDDLKVGTGVRFAAEMGEKGLQASTVEQVEKRGAAETHQELHALPSVASVHSRKRRRVGPATRPLMIKGKTTTRK